MLARQDGLNGFILVIDGVGVKHGYNLVPDFVTALIEAGYVDYVESDVVCTELGASLVTVWVAVF